MPYKKFKSGDGYKVWKVDEDGKKVGDPMSNEPMTEAKADAQVRALYASENKKEIDSNPEIEEKCYDEMAPMPVMGGPTSLKEMVRAKMAGEAAEEMHELTTMFKMVVDNIMMSDSEEKEAMLIRAAGEFAEMGRTVNSKIERENPFTKEAVDLAKEANEQAKAQIAGGHDKAKWTTAFINTLPDSSFLYIKPGGEKDGEGKTTPRSLRYFPYKDADGKVDLPHLRNAISRAPQADLPADVIKRVQDKARKVLDDQSKEITPGDDLFIWKEGGVYKWIAAYSNNRRDDDNPPEIISSESHKEFDEALNKGEYPMPELWLWHLPYRVGVAQWHAYDEQKGFPVAAGVFDVGKEWVAESLMNSKEWTGVSHGMPKSYIKRDPNDETIIIRHVTKEISILPAWAAANKLSFHLISKENQMQDEKGLPAHKLEGLVNLAGEERAKEVEAALADKAKEADEAGIEKKEETPKEVKPKALTDKELVEAFVAVKESLSAIEQRLATLEATRAEETKAADEFDLVTFLKSKSVVGAPEAKVDGRTTLAKDGPEETKPGSMVAPTVGMPIGLVDRLVQANQAYQNGGR